MSTKKELWWHKFVNPFTEKDWHNIFVAYYNDSDLIKEDPDEPHYEITLELDLKNWALPLAFYIYNNHYHTKIYQIWFLFFRFEVRKDVSANELNNLLSKEDDGVLF